MDDSVYICQEDENHFDALRWWKTNLDFVEDDLGHKYIHIVIVASELTFSVGMGWLRVIVLH